MRLVPAVPLCLFLMAALLTGCGSRSSSDGVKTADAAPAIATPAAPPNGTDSAAAAAAVIATMRRVYDGFVHQDAAAINAAVPATGMLYVGPDGVMSVTSPEGTTAMVKQCAVRSYAMDSVQATVPAPDLALLSFRLTIVETCAGQKSPSPDYVMSTWQRRGGTWRAIAFSATPAAGAR